MTNKKQTVSNNGTKHSNGCDTSQPTRQDGGKKSSEGRLEPPLTPDREVVRQLNNSK